jgi:hypothetical protein
MNGIQEALPLDGQKAVNITSFAYFQGKDADRFVRNSVEGLLVIDF